MRLKSELLTMRSTCSGNISDFATSSGTSCLSTTIRCLVNAFPDGVAASLSVTSCCRRRGLCSRRNGRTHFRFRSIDRCGLWWAVFVSMLAFNLSVASEETSGGLPPNTFLRITTIEVEPYVMIERQSSTVTSLTTPVASYLRANRTAPTSAASHADDTANGKQRYTGYIPELLQALSALLDFRYELYVVADGSYGFKKSHTQWTGMIGELLNGNADVAAGPILITEDRRKVVDFTTPFMLLQATLLLRRPAAGQEPKVKDLADLVGQSEIKYGTLRRGVIPRSFRHTNDSLLTIVWRNMRRFGASVLTNTNEEGIEKVRREKFAFVLPDTIGDYVAQRAPCDLVAVGRFLERRGYALALQKQSRYAADFNRGLRTLRKNGYLDRLKAQWWTERGQCGGVVGSARTGRMSSGRYLSTSHGSAPKGSRLAADDVRTTCVLNVVLCWLTTQSLRLLAPTQL